MIPQRPACPQSSDLAEGDGRSVTILYLALNVVYALALSAADIHALVPDPSKYEQLKAVDNIAQLAAARLFGARWSTALSLAIGLMLLSTLSVYVLIGPRVVFAMAKAGQFPAMAARLTKVRRNTRRGFDAA